MKKIVVGICSAGISITSIQKIKRWTYQGNDDQHIIRTKHSSHRRPRHDPQSHEEDQQRVKHNIDHDVLVAMCDRVNVVGRRPCGEHVCGWNLHFAVRMVVYSVGRMVVLDLLVVAADAVGWVDRWKSRE